MEIVLIFIYLLIAIAIFGLYVVKDNYWILFMIVLLISFAGYLNKYRY